MKKKIKLKKKTIQKLQLKLKAKSDRKVAPLLVAELEPDPSNGQGGAGCTRGSQCYDSY
jgi:hypothetical protein